MTFELMRLNWPNTAAILALMMMPMVALATLTPAGRPAASEERVLADATNGPLPYGTVTALATDPTPRWNSALLK